MNDRFELTQSGRRNDVIRFDSFDYFNRMCIVILYNTNSADNQYGSFYYYSNNLSVCIIRSVELPHYDGVRM